MDNLTHSLVGALIGQAGLKRKTGLGMAALIVGANIPDIDAACLLWLDGVEHVGFRRGITHGPPAMLLLPLVLAIGLWAFDKWQAKRGKRPEARLPVRFGWLYLLGLIGCLSHPAMDWLNVYGVRLLEPFSHRWFYGDVLFIIDIWLWLGMGFATWFSLRREKRGGEWRKPARIALAGVLAYIGFNASLTWNAENYYSYAPNGSDVVIASPAPVIFLRRQLITGGNGRYAIAGNVISDFELSNCDLEAARKADPEVAAFLFWSRAPFAERARDGGWVLYDARFYDPLSKGRFSVDLPADACHDPAGG